MSLNFSIGILSMRAPKTLRNTLQSYVDGGLFDICDDVIIYFNSVTQTDLDIAEEFGITHILSSEDNIGIGKAFEQLVLAAKHDNICILEDDWVLIEDKETIKEVMIDSCDMLDTNQFDFIRLRHSENPGDPLYTRQFAEKEYKSFEHLLDAIHWHGVTLAIRFPDKIKYEDTEHTEFMYCDSYYGNHTNNPFMCTRKFYLDNIAPYSGVGNALEGQIREPWRKAGYRVAHNIPGLFTHYRIDRS